MFSSPVLLFNFDWYIFLEERVFASRAHNCSEKFYPYTIAFELEDRNLKYRIISRSLIHFHYRQLYFNWCVYLAFFIDSFLCCSGSSLQAQSSYAASSMAKTLPPSFLFSVVFLCMTKIKYRLNHEEVRGCKGLFNFNFCACKFLCQIRKTSIAVCRDFLSDLQFYNSVKVEYLYCMHLAFT